MVGIVPEKRAGGCGCMREKREGEERKGGGGKYVSGMSLFGY